MNAVKVAKSALLCLNISGSGLNSVQSQIASALLRVAAENESVENSLYVHMYSSSGRKLTIYAQMVSLIYYELCAY